MKTDTAAQSLPELFITRAEYNALLRSFGALNVRLDDIKEAFKNAKALKELDPSYPVDLSFYELHIEETKQASEIIRAMCMRASVAEDA
ncbi:hypothetical protein [Photobacterium gaetbulicola]|nr:hypothetical protein [Photobacterium gaetbulicola]